MLLLLLLCVGCWSSNSVKKLVILHGNVQRMIQYAGVYSTYSTKLHLQLYCWVTSIRQCSVNVTSLLLRGCRQLSAVNFRQVDFNGGGVAPFTRMETDVSIADITRPRCSPYFSLLHYICWMYDCIFMILSLEIFVYFCDLVAFYYGTTVEFESVKKFSLAMF